jgi:hypothetical protein
MCCSRWARRCRQAPTLPDHRSPPRRLAGTGRGAAGEPAVKRGGWVSRGLCLRVTVRTGLLRHIIETAYVSVSEILTGRPPLLLQGPDVVGGQKLGERVGVRVEYLLAAVVLQRKV